jgi:hypothetical protein
MLYFFLQVGRKDCKVASDFISSRDETSGLPHLHISYARILDFTYTIYLYLSVSRCGMHTMDLFIIKTMYLERGEKHETCKHRQQQFTGVSVVHFGQ